MSNRNKEWNEAANRWEDAGLKTVKGGPVKAIVTIFFVVLMLGIGFSVVGYTVGWFGEAAQVAREEFGPRALLKKYEMFKDMSASLDAKLATISRMEKRPRRMEDDYEGTSRKDWDRVDKQQHSLWITEIEGVAASFNQLASEYNSAMSKANYSFTNVGDLPKGATKPLPREYKAYLY